MKRLTITEEILLLTIWRLKDDAYGVTIRDRICEYYDSDVGFGTLYNNLDQLVKKGYVKAEKGEPSPVRGGKRKVYYSITKEGLQSLKNARELHNKLWDGVPDYALDWRDNEE
ncbi:MAG: PadR family transcriptional regulator [bacterium]|nr:PadR family transcriptional regulator [bacterium]